MLERRATCTLIQYSYSHTITYVATYYMIQKSHSESKNNYEEYVTGMMMESDANAHKSD